MKYRLLKMSLAALVIATTIITAVGCNSGRNLGTLKPDKLIVGTESYEPPFVYTENGNLVGFDIDIAKALGKELDLDVVFVQTPFKNLISELESGKFDVILSGMIITPKRKERISFSTPYVDSDQSICVIKGSPIRDEAGLSGMAAGVQTGTVGAARAEEMKGLKEIRLFTSYEDAVNAMIRGEVAAVIHDYPINLFTSRETGETEVIAVIATGDKCGIGIVKENPGLLEAIDDALEDILKSAEYKTAYDKWFAIGH